MRTGPKRAEAQDEAPSRFHVAAKKILAGRLKKMCEKIDRVLQHRGDGANQICLFSRLYLARGLLYLMVEQRLLTIPS